MKTLIIHDTDPDGLLSAVVLGEHLEECGHSVRYTPGIRYQKPDYSKITKDTAVYIVDFSYGFQDTCFLANKCHNVTILDHHKTTIEELGEHLPENVDLRVHLDKSACRVVWEFCHGSEDAPWQVDYVEDMDLWKFEQPQSRVINAALDAEEPTIDNWKQVLELSFGETRDAGYAIERYKSKTIRHLIAQAVLMQIGSWKVPAVCCSDPSLVSYLGNELAKGQPFGATFYLQPNGLWKFSIRSIIGEGLPGVDVSEVAALFGGGGHRQAAGFKVCQLFQFDTIPSNAAKR